MTMLTQSRALFRRPSASPNTGTSTTYMAVRKPALAVEGLRMMPICWAAEARKRNVPQTTPAVSRVLRSFLALGQP